jgi:hypothetical protein
LSFIIQKRPNLKRYRKAFVTRPDFGAGKLKFSLGNYKVEDVLDHFNCRNLNYYRKASLWAENCPNFLAGTSPDFGAGKTEVFSRKLKGVLDFRQTFAIKYL